MRRDVLFMLFDYRARMPLKLIAHKYHCNISTVRKYMDLLGQRRYKPRGTNGKQIHQIPTDRGAEGRKKVAQAVACKRKAYAGAR
jgi:hypothetical protein